jgi:hypothetical protein
LVLLLVCALCAGQSLGDAARQNRQQKKPSGTTAKKVYTTDDMTDPVPAVAHGPQDLSGTWNFTHFDDRFQGWITLRHSGSTLEGTWHTSSGKSEPDTLVTCSVAGAVVTLQVPRLEPAELQLDSLGGWQPAGWFWRRLFFAPHESQHDAK